MAEPAKPGRLDRLRARYSWLDHVIRAGVRYVDAKGDFYAAGITYFTIFALFPLLMLGFAAAGTILASRPHLLADIEQRIRTTVSGQLGQQLVELMDTAIASRTSVGIIGIATAAWIGLSWMNNLREALSQMWEQRGEKQGYFPTMLSDFFSLISVFVAIALTIALTALADPALMARVLEWAGIHDAAWWGVVFQVVSRVLSLLVSWLLFTWIIARLPRESASLRSTVRAGLMATVGFEIFKQAGAIYLRAVAHGPAGTTFGPLFGLMVFAYITARLLLFSTAWAATGTARADEAEAAIGPAAGDSASGLP